MPAESGDLPVVWWVFWMALGTLLTAGLLWWIVDQARQTDEDTREESP